MKSRRRSHSGRLKVKVALAAPKGDRTIAELASEFEVHPSQVTQWKKQLLKALADVFSRLPAMKGLTGVGPADTGSKVCARSSGADIYPARPVTSALLAGILRIQDHQRSPRCSGVERGSWAVSDGIGPGGQVGTSSPMTEDN